MAEAIYAVGDIHGHVEKLQEVLECIERDGGHDAKIVFLGDLVDRGPDSQRVVETLRLGVAQGRNWTVLKGNHDRMFEYFMEPSPRPDLRLRLDLYWLHERLGGDKTLMSYGVPFSADAKLGEIHAAALEVVPESHVTFLQGLPYHLQLDSQLFVHAGVRPGVALENQSVDDLCWIREPFLSHTGAYPWMVVHGHTPVDQVTHFGNRICVDTGAGYGRALSVAVFEGRSTWALSKDGRQPLTPM
ncbi:metallophosphoesterase family protein [Shimia sp. NS0008-38b]|uniref:metallophosphoesterase family protein n=1 Tax=Shimia sp. NS0008-38b TaxID=3127653 RepID=UPI00310BBA4E